MIMTYSFVGFVHLLLWLAQQMVPVMGFSLTMLYVFPIIWKEVQDVTENSLSFLNSGKGCWYELVRLNGESIVESLTLNCFVVCLVYFVSFFYSMLPYCLDAGILS